MEIVTGKESTELADSEVHTSEPASGQDGSGQTMTGLEFISDSFLQARRRRARAKLQEPKTTWVWDRTGQAWMEIIESPVGEALPGGNSTPTPDSVLIQEPSAAPVPLPRRTPRRASTPRLQAIRSSLSRMLNVLILKAGSSQPQPPAASTTELVKRGETRLVAGSRREAEDLAAIIVDRAAKEARKTLANAMGTARALEEQAEKESERSSLTKIAAAEQLSKSIATATEDQAEARAETIVSKAEEKTKIRAERIIAKAMETAEAAAVNIIADAGEKSRARAESIVSQAIERAEAQARAMVAKAEERARAHAERIAAATEEACRKRLSETEAQARWLIAAAEGQARDAAAQALPSVTMLPEQTSARVPAPAPVIVQSQPTRIEAKKPKTPGEGQAELVIKHPVNIGRMQKMINRLARYPEIRIFDLEGSPGQGVTIKLYSYRLERLPSVLQALPEVDKVAQLPTKSGKICLSQRVCPSLGRGGPVTRLLVTLEKRDAILDV